MQIRKVLFGLAIALFATSSLVAQDVDKKAKKALERATKNATNQMMRQFEKANLTDDQKSKASAIVEKHVKKLNEARKEQEALLSDEQKAKRKEASEKAKADGKKGQAMFKAGFEAMGLSGDTLTKFNECKKKITGVNGQIKKEITALLTDEQKAAMPKKGKGKGKGKGAKKGKGKNQTVSLKLPNMT